VLCFGVFPKTSPEKRICFKIIYFGSDAGKQGGMGK
jgi:hypothetical protein